jgi:hypothetical protein
MQSDNSSNTQFESLFKILTIIHAAMAIMIIAFALLLIFLFSENSTFDLSNTNNPLFILVPVAFLGGLLGSTIVYKKQLTNLLTIEKENDKIMAFQSAFIIKLALLEGPILFGLVAFLLMSNTFYLGLSGLMLIYFILQRPIRSKIKMDLGLHN